MSKTTFSGHFSQQEFPMSHPSSSSSAHGRLWEKYSSNSPFASIDVLFAEVFFLIFKKLDPSDILNLRFVSKNLSRVSYGNSLWKKVALRINCPIDSKSSKTPEEQVRTNEWVFLKFYNILAEEANEVEYDAWEALADEKDKLLNRAEMDEDQAAKILYDEPFPEFHLEWPKKTVFKNSAELFAEAKLARLEYAKNRDFFFAQVYKIDDLRLQNLTCLPKEIWDLTRLEFLNLSNNKLAYLPSEIGDFTELAELDLRHNNLTTLPSVIGKLPNLKILYIDDNPIKWLPLEIDSLSLEDKDFDFSIPRMTKAEAREKFT